MLFSVNGAAALTRAFRGEALAAHSLTACLFVCLSRSAIIWTQSLYVANGLLEIIVIISHDNGKWTTALVQVHEGLHLFYWIGMSKKSICCCDTKRVIIAA